MNKNMYVEDKCAKHVSMNQRPYGYVLIRSGNPLAQLPSYWGEIELRAKNGNATFCYTIENFDNQKGLYHLHLFGDREFKYRVIETYIEFIDHDSRLMTANTVFTDQNIGIVPDEVFNLMHHLIYGSVVELLPAIFQSEPWIDISTVMERGYIFGIKRQVVDDFQNETFVPFENVASAINLLLG